MQGKGGCGSGFMSAGFDLFLIGALLQLWLFTIATLSLFLALCCFRQSLNLVHPSVSMRLRPKRYVGFIYFFVYFLLNLC